LRDWPYDTSAADSGWSSVPIPASESLGDKKSPCLSMRRRALFCPPEEGFLFFGNGWRKGTDGKSQSAGVGAKHFCQKKRKRDTCSRIRRQADD